MGVGNQQGRCCGPRGAYQTASASRGSAATLPTVPAPGGRRGSRAEAEAAKRQSGRLRPARPGVLVSPFSGCSSERRSTPPLFPGSSPSWLTPSPRPSLSLALNLLYNFKIKLGRKKKAGKRERAPKAKHLPQSLSLQGGGGGVLEEGGVSAYVKKDECKGCPHSLSTE